MTVSDITATTAVLKWSGSGGTVMVNAEPLGTTDLLNYALSGLNSESDYVVSIVNESGESNKVEFKTLAERTVTTLDDFSDLTDWKLQSSVTETSVSVDTVNTLKEQSMMLKTNNNTDIAFVKNGTLDLNLTTYDAFEIAVFVKDLTKLENFIFFVGNDVALTNRGTITYRQSNLKAGWNHLIVPFDSLTSYGEFDLAKSIKALQLRIKSTDANGTSVSIDQINLVKESK